eukprot:4740243-Prorocentrum_lima.AAC.1
MDTSLPGVVSSGGPAFVPPPSTDAPMPDVKQDDGTLPPAFTHGYQCYECSAFLLRVGFMP